ncbi:aminodeoxychorismate lyase [Caldalkalibacillus thermarum]|uniref:endolytic transglycosylase MltG n=1 Tax=Caldalkalibacillus thermarum TaxID=296745 RepID=UPI001668980A|nr:endolytic transglycosylase MltG [Caldalkalibacillus thermarum]GGK20127.1 aminodeoxychorismate lyase [Caldalkalibacillus thermarum]
MPNKPLTAQRKGSSHILLTFIHPYANKLVVAAVLLFLSTATLGVYVYQSLQPVDPHSEQVVEVNIPEGASGREIASILKEQQLIRNEDIFYFFVRMQGGVNFKAGRHHLSPSMSMPDIVAHLESQTYAESELVTIPEGLTVEQVAERLAEAGLVDQHRFLKLINHGDFSDITFVRDIPEKEDRPYRLEGFLFPETYHIPQGADEEEIIRIMLREFERRYQDWKELAEDSPYHFYDIVILASLIEREAAVDSERRTIAGVLHNRLEAGMKLQVDATVQYALGEHVERVLYEHLEIDHPYNTYQHEGLPPGPIANPGLDSILAALKPEKHQFKYYVLKNDGTREHYFAETYKEHLENIRKARAQQ